jgi:hypothetical protein
MAATERITMTMRELDRLKVIQDVADGTLRPWRAAERLGLTTRQIRRLTTRFREAGVAGMVSRKRGVPGNRRLDDELAQRALAIVRERYADFGPTLACEKLGRMRPVATVGPGQLNDADNIVQQRRKTASQPASPSLAIKIGAAVRR